MWQFLDVKLVVLKSAIDIVSFTFTMLSLDSVVSIGLFVSF